MRAPTASLRSTISTLEGLRLEGRGAGEAFSPDLSSLSGRDLMMTLPACFAHQRMTFPQPCREASQVMGTTRAEPVSLAKNAAYKVLGIKGQRRRPRVA